MYYLLLAFFISCHCYLCSFEHLFSCHFYFAYLSFSFSFSKYLITNSNPKKLLMALGLFGYYPWHYGAWDFFLDLGLETLAYVGDLMTLIDILYGVHGVYLKTLGCLFVFCVQVFVITLSFCNLEFTRIHPLLCPIFAKTKYT